ncbi:unknown protein [Rivularia sp. IAM M-261]|nr:unknown protein [Calothrix sp. PCC 7716]GJD22190.1 unknown protein [Rivularia sp. IAM M-261]
MPKLNSTQDFRLLLPETVCLEAEHLALASSTSALDKNNADISWQVYLNTLALLALEAWLDNKFADIGAVKVYRDLSQIAIAGSLKLGDYKLCAIATEHLLNEIVNIPQEIIEQPQLTPHFYVLLEVLEEEEEVIIRGFLPYKQLIEIQNELQLPVHNGAYQIPFSYFDTEPNHIVTYYRYAQPSEFTVAIIDKVNQVNPVKQIHSNITKLSQWLQGIIDEGWKTIDALANPELALAFSTRNTNQDTKKAKIINLGLDLNTKFALLVCISPDISEDTQEEKINVLAQLYPFNGEKFLPPNIKLILLSKAGKTLQEVTARFQDNYLQLKSFKGKPGTKFSIQVSFGDINVSENFEL